MNQQVACEPHWVEEKDWLCAVEHFLRDDPQGRSFAAEILGYLMGYAHLTNTRALALIGDAKDSAYEFLFSFSSAEEKNRFLDMVRSNEDMGECYVENDLVVPSISEISRARPIAKVVPGDVLYRATLIATSLCSGIFDEPVN